MDDLMSFYKDFHVICVSIAMHVGSLLCTVIILYALQIVLYDVTNGRKIQAMCACRCTLQESIDILRHNLNLCYQPIVPGTDACILARQKPIGW